MERLPKLDAVKLGKRIADIRNQRGWSQGKLGILAGGINQQTISLWEGGGGSVSFIELLAIAKALDVSVLEFADPKVVNLRRLPESVAEAVKDHVEAIDQILGSYQQTRGPGTRGA